MSLPRHRGPPRPPRDLDAAPGPAPHARRPRAGGGGAAPRLSLAGIRVMMIDDQAEVREYVSAVLETYQASVHALPSGRAALAALRELEHRHWPDVLLCDLSLGDEDGHHVLAEIRRIETQRAPGTGPPTPAVALTGHAQPADRARALRAGFQVHMAKPFDPAELARTVARLAGRSARAGRPPH